MDKRYFHYFMDQKKRKLFIFIDCSLSEYENCFLYNFFFSFLFFSSTFSLFTYLLGPISLYMSWMVCCFLFLLFFFQIYRMHFSYYIIVELYFIVLCSDLKCNFIEKNASEPFFSLFTD